MENDDSSVDDVLSDTDLEFLFDDKNFKTLIKK